MSDHSLNADEHLDVLALVPDLMFGSRIASLAQRAGRTLSIARTLAEFEQAVVTRHPTVVVVDLSARGVDVGAAIRKAKSGGTSEVIAFGPHKDLAARAIAREAGADRWVTNQQLAEILRASWDETARQQGAPSS